MRADQRNFCQTQESACKTDVHFFSIEHFMAVLEKHFVPSSGLHIFNNNEFQLWASYCKINFKKLIVKIKNEYLHFCFIYLFFLKIIIDLRGEGEEERARNIIDEM